IAAGVVSLMGTLSTLNPCQSRVLLLFYLFYRLSPAIESNETPNVTTSSKFTYFPPKTAFDAKHVLVKPNLGYPVAAPVTVSIPVLNTVLQGLRRASPNATISIVEGVCSAVSLAEIASLHGVYELLDEGMQLLDADTLPLSEYPNRSPSPVRFQTLLAPKLLQTVDCRISVSAFKRTQLKGEPLISASLKNLYGLFPRAKYKARSPNSRGQLHRPSVPSVLQDVYFSIGHLFDGGVVDVTQKFVSHDWKPDRGEAIAIGKIVWGNDLIDVDRTACQIADEPNPIYLDEIDRIRTGGRQV
ncbi:DUF362 domain-containing protein, partial [Baaleninema simplex]|uniref:DUF362 domain-containing protein n=1 Tax=Baaleninema simplex TaxID=2862350 RepID=UPI00316AEC83